MKRPITPPATLGMLDYQNADHEQLMKRLRPAPSVEEVLLKMDLPLNDIFSFFVFLLLNSPSNLLVSSYQIISNSLNFVFLLSFQVTYPTVRQQASWSLDDLPRTVAFTLQQGSSVTSMDFHPSHHTLLLGI